MMPPRPWLAGPRIPSRRTRSHAERGCTIGTSTLAPIGRASLDHGACPGGGCAARIRRLLLVRPPSTLHPPSPARVCPSIVAFISAGSGQHHGGRRDHADARAPGHERHHRVFELRGWAAPAIQLSNGPVLRLLHVERVNLRALGLSTSAPGRPASTMTGMMVGDVDRIAMGPGQPWTFNSPRRRPRRRHLDSSQRRRHR